MSGTTPTNSKDLFQQRKSKASSNAGAWDENVRPGRRLSWNAASHSRDSKEVSNGSHVAYERRLSWDGQSNASIPLSQSSIPLSRLPSSTSLAPDYTPHIPSSVKEIPITLPSVHKQTSKSTLAIESSNAKSGISGENRAVTHSNDSEDGYNYQLLRQSSYYRTNEFLHQKKLIDMHNAQVLNMLECFFNPIFDI